MDFEQRMREDDWIMEYPDLDSTVIATIVTRFKFLGEVKEAPLADNHDSEEFKQLTSCQSPQA